MDARELIDTLLGGQERVRRYLRGVEAESETDLEAMDNMETAVEYLRASDVTDAMASEMTKTYASACLCLCGEMTDGEDNQDKFNRLWMQLRYHPRNIAELRRTDGSNDIRG